MVVLNLDSLNSTFFENNVTKYINSSSSISMNPDKSINFTNA